MTHHWQLGPSLSLKVTLASFVSVSVSSRFDSELELEANHFLSLLTMRYDQASMNEMRRAAHNSQPCLRCKPYAKLAKPCIWLRVETIKRFRSTDSLRSPSQSLQVQRRQSDSEGQTHSSRVYSRNLQKGLCTPLLVRASAASSIRIENGKNGQPLSCAIAALDPCPF